MKLRNMLIENSISLPERRSCDIFPDLLGAASRRRDDNWNSSCKTDVQFDVDKTTNFHFWNDDIFSQTWLATKLNYESSRPTRDWLHSLFPNFRDLLRDFSCRRCCSCEGRLSWLQSQFNIGTIRPRLLSDWHMIQRILQASFFCNGTRLWQEVLHSLLWLR